MGQTTHRALKISSKHCQVLQSTRLLSKVLHFSGKKTNQSLKQNIEIYFLTSHFFVVTIRKSKSYCFKLLAKKISLQEHLRNSL